MSVTRRKLLQQLDGDNAGQDVNEPPARHVPRTMVREQFPYEDLEWAENTLDRCGPDVNADHQIVFRQTAQARIYFGTGFNTQEHKTHTSSFLIEGLQQIFDGTLIDEASWVVTRNSRPRYSTLGI